MAPRTKHAQLSAPEFGPIADTSTIVVVCPIAHAQFNRSDPHVWGRFDETLVDLRANQPFKIRGSFYHSGDTFKTSVTKATKRDLTLCGLKPKLPGLDISYSLLRCSADLEFPGSRQMPMEHFPQPQIGPPHISYFSEIDAWRHWNRFLPDDLDVDIKTFLLSICIASGGSVYPREARWTVGGQKVDHKTESINPVADAVEFLAENGLRMQSSLAVATTHRWVCRRNGIFHGYSDDAASRALNLFTRLFTNVHREDELGNLVWALAGIEALLVQGGRSSIGQLQEKLLAIFNGRVDQRWLFDSIKRTYDFRPRMVHGDRQVRSFFRNWEDDSEKRFEEEYDSERFAVGILVYLLRMLVENDGAEFKFETKLKTPTPS